MKTISKNTVLCCKDKTYQPIEVDGVIYWVDKECKIKNCYVYITHLSIYNTKHIRHSKELDLSIGTHELHSKQVYKIIAQSQPKLKEIPVIELSLSESEFLGKIYTQKDIEKALFLKTGFDKSGYTKYMTDEEILEQINSISVIKVDEQFNIVNYV